MATASNAITVATHPEAQGFWSAVAEWPEQAQRAFWEASTRLSEFIGENPSPQLLLFDHSKPPPGMPWWERILFHYGQSQHNRGVVAQAQARAAVDGARWLWGALQGDFNRSPTTGQIVTGGVLSMIPVVDQLCDVRDVVANCLTLSDEDGRRNDDNWLALGLTCFGFIPELGSAVKTVAKVAVHNSVRLIDIVKRMEWLESLGGKVRLPWGRAPVGWLQRYDWAAAAKTAGVAARRAFQNALQKVEAAIQWAAGAIKARLQQLAQTFKAIIARVEQAISDAALKVRDSIHGLLRRDKREIGRFDASPGGVPNKHVQKHTEPPRREASPPRARTARILAADEANAVHIAAGRNPPYKSGTTVKDLTMLEDTTFVRVHGADNKARSWMMQPGSIEGLTPQEIRDIFALPETPLFASDVLVPAGTTVRVGEVAPQAGWGKGGGTQFELLQRLPEDRFVNTRSL